MALNIFIPLNKENIFDLFYLFACTDPVFYVICFNSYLLKIFCFFFILMKKNYNSVTVLYFIPLITDICPFMK